MRRIAVLMALTGVLALVPGAGGQGSTETVVVPVDGTATTATSFTRANEWTMRIEGVVTRTTEDGHVLRYDAVHCFEGCKPGGRTYNGLMGSTPGSSGFHEIAAFGTPLDPAPEAPQQPRYSDDHVYFFRLDDAVGRLTFQAPPWGFAGEGDQLAGSYTVVITDTTALVEDVRLKLSAKHAGLPHDPPPFLVHTTLEAKGTAVVEGQLDENRPSKAKGAVKGTLVLHEVTDGKVDPVTVLRIGPKATYGRTTASARALETAVTVRRSTRPGCQDGAKGTVYFSDERDAIILRFCGRRYIFGSDIDVRLREAPKQTPARR